jgi:hypothetical protein
LRIQYTPCTVYEKGKIIIILPLNTENSKTKENYLVWTHLAYTLPSKHVTGREKEVTGRRRSRPKQQQDDLKGNKIPELETESTI